MLTSGMPPGEVVAGLADIDKDYAYRQVAVLTPGGEGAAHTGAKCGQWAGHIVGDDYIVAGNGLTDQGVSVAMAGAFEAASGRSVEERLLAGMEAGRDAGGQVRHYYERSATLIVCEQDTFPDIDLRVDYHPEDAVAELRSLLELYTPYLHIYNHVRTKEPENAAKMTDGEWDPTPEEA